MNVGYNEWVSYNGSGGVDEFHIIFMFDNFVEESYHPSDLVYTHK